MRPMHQLADGWARRAPRERSLALVVAGLLAAFAVLLTGRAALRSIDQLDGEINRLQSDIVNYTYQIARREAVEDRYAQVAAQHSSAWSESEIRDRLRQEIYRLRFRVPPRLDARGIPVSTEGEGDALVSIPELGSGHLVDNGEGFREYRIDFDLPPVPFPDLLAYLEYLQDSPQSLRIDHIDLRRDPRRPEIAARLGLTRIVVDDLSEGLPEPASLAARAEPVTLRPEDWTVTGALVSPVDGAGDSTALTFLSDGMVSEVWLRRMVPAGAVYDVELEVAASAPALLAVRTTQDSGPVKEGVEIPGDGEFYRYHLQFRGAEEGDRVAVDVPCLSWFAPDATVTVRNLRMAPLVEGSRGA